MKICKNLRKDGFPAEKEFLFKFWLGKNFYSLVSADSPPALAKATKAVVKCFNEI